MKEGDNEKSAKSCMRSPRCATVNRMATRALRMNPLTGQIERTPEVIEAVEVTLDAAANRIPRAGVDGVLASSWYGPVPISVLPVTQAGVADPNRLVRSDDPRLATRSLLAVTGAVLAAGDFVAVVSIDGEERCVPARADVHRPGAIGFVTDAKGIGETVEIFTSGENPLAVIPGVTMNDVTRVVFLSATPGKLSLTPPTIGVLQPVGVIAGVQERVRVILRFEFRFLL